MRETTLLAVSQKPLGAASPLLASGGGRMVRAISRKVRPENDIHQLTYLPFARW